MTNIKYSLHVSSVVFDVPQNTLRAVLEDFVIGLMFPGDARIKA